MEPHYKSNSMPTSSSSNLTKELRDDLTRYGLTRDKAKEEAPVSESDPNFFGISERGSVTELTFSKDLRKLVDSKAQISLVAPENESFNMLVTKDLPKAIKDADEDTLRAFVTRILEEA